MTPRRGAVLCVVAASVGTYGLAEGPEKSERDRIHALVKRAVLDHRAFSELEAQLRAKGWSGDDWARHHYEQVWKTVEAHGWPGVEQGSGMGGVAESGESEPNDDADTANPLALGDIVQGAIDPDGDVDFWTFTVAQTTGIVLGLTTQRSPLDPVLTLLGADENLLDQDDDDGPGTDSRIVTVVPAGTYYVVVAGTGGSRTGAYEMLTSGTTQIGPVDDRAVVEVAIEEAPQFFAFQVPESSDVDLRCHSLNSGLDAALRLAAANGAVLEEDDDDGSSFFDPRIVATLPAGAYWVAADGFEGQSRGAGLYENVASPEALPNRTESEPNDDLGTADQAQCCDIAGGDVSPAGDLDFFTFALNMETDLVLTADTPQSELDPQLVLYDESGLELATDDDSGPDLDSRIRLRLPAGDYLAAVRGYSDSIGSYRLTVLCSAAYVPLAVESEPNDDFESADPLRPGDSIGASIDVSGDRDLFLLEIGTPMELAIATRATTDTRLRVFDSGGEEIYFNEDDADDPAAALRAIFLSTASYFVQVEAGAGVSGPYELLVAAPFGRPGVARAGEDTTFYVEARNQDLFYILAGTTTASIPTQYGMQLIDPANFILFARVPPCGVLPLTVSVPSDLAGRVFLTQALVGHRNFGAGRFSNLLEVSIE